MTRSRSAQGAADQGLGHDRPVGRLPVTKIRADGARPVDVAKAGTAGPARAVDRAADGRGRAPAEFLHEIRDDFRHDHPRGGLGPFGHGRAQADEIGDEMDVGLEGLEKFRLEQQRLQVEPVEGVALDDLDDRRREELPDLAEPARDFRRRGAESAALVLFRRRRVEHRQRQIEPAVSLRQAVVGLAAEREAPAAPAFVRFGGLAHAASGASGSPSMVSNSGSAAAKPGA
jgi:hypothetical protein